MGGRHGKLDTGQVQIRQQPSSQTESTEWPMAISAHLIRGMVLPNYHKQEFKVISYVLGNFLLGATL